MRVFRKRLVLFIAGFMAVAVGCMAQQNIFVPDMDDVLNDYCERVPVTRCMINEAQKVVNKVLGYKIDLLIGGPETIVIYADVHPTKSILAKAYSDKNIRLFYGDISFPDKHYFPVCLYSLIPEKAQEPRCWSLQTFDDKYFVVEKLSAGRPENDWMVYRMMDNICAYTLDASNYDFLRKMRFLSVEDGTLVVANGLAETVEVWKSELLPDEEALELSTKFVDNGFNSVFGKRNAGDSAMRGWETLWLVQARVGKDGDKKLEVVEIESSLSEDDADLAQVIACADVTKNADAKAYYWRLTYMPDDGQGRVWELCEVGMDGKPQVVDRFANDEEPRRYNLVWTVEAGTWNDRVLVRGLWKTHRPLIAVTGDGSVVASRADGYIAICK